MIYFQSMPLDTELKDCVQDFILVSNQTDSYEIHPVQIRAGVNNAHTTTLHTPTRNVSIMKLQGPLIKYQ